MSASGAEAVLAAADKIAANAQAVAAIRALHGRRPLLIRGTTVEAWKCGHCAAEYPCRTVAILEEHGV